MWTNAGWVQPGLPSIATAHCNYNQREKQQPHMQHNHPIYSNNRLYSQHTLVSTSVQSCSSMLLSVLLMLEREEEQESAVAPSAPSFWPLLLLAERCDLYVWAFPAMRLDRRCLLLVWDGRRGWGCGCGFLLGERWGWMEWACFRTSTSVNWTEWPPPFVFKMLPWANEIGITLKTSNNKY